MIHLPPDRLSMHAISTMPFWCQPNTAHTNAMTIIIGRAVTVDPEDNGSIMTMSQKMTAAS
jgi:hypothetical protein